MLSTPTACWATAVRETASRSGASRGSVSMLRMPAHVRALARRASTGIGSSASHRSTSSPELRRSARPSSAMVRVTSTRIRDSSSGGSERHAIRVRRALDFVAPASPDSTSRRWSSELPATRGHDRGGSDPEQNDKYSSPYEEISTRSGPAAGLGGAVGPTAHRWGLIRVEDRRQFSIHAKEISNRRSSSRRKIRMESRWTRQANSECA